MNVRRVPNGWARTNGSMTTLRHRHRPCHCRPRGHRHPGRPRLMDHAGLRLERQPVLGPARRLPQALRPHRVRGDRSVRGVRRRSDTGAADRGSARGPQGTAPGGARGPRSQRPVHPAPDGGQCVGRYLAAAARPLPDRCQRGRAAGRGQRLDQGTLRLAAPRRPVRLRRLRDGRPRGGAHRAAGALAYGDGVRPARRSRGGSHRPHRRRAGRFRSTAPKPPTNTPVTASGVRSCPWHPGSSRLPPSASSRCRVPLPPA